MKVKSVFAPEMHQAVQGVREDERPDAVTLSSRQADGGFGIIAALDGATIANRDEAAGLGGVLSTVTKQHLPVMFVANGQRVPEDLCPTHARNFVDQAGEQSGIAERLCHGRAIWRIPDECSCLSCR